MDEKKDESNNEPVGNVSFEQCEDKPSTPKSPKLSRAGKSTRSIAQMQALSLKGDKYLLNGTVRKDWMAGKGEVATHFMLQGGVEERVGRLVWFWAATGVRTPNRGVIPRHRIGTTKRDHPHH